MSSYFVTTDIKFVPSEEDIFYRSAKAEGFRARSAYKLLHVDEITGVFKNVTRAVDLCAAPGSWSQLLAHRLRQNVELNRLETDSITNCSPSSPSNSLKTSSDGLVVSIDLQEMAPIDGCSILQGDITLPSTADRIVEQFHGSLAQLVVCDGAPDVTGFHAVDEHLQSQLLFAAIAIAARILERGGAFVAKIFKGDCEEVLVAQMQLLFEQVDVIKPSSSRSRSAEHFIVGRGFFWPRDLMKALMVVGEGANTLENALSPHGIQQIEEKNEFESLLTEVRTMVNQPHLAPFFEHNFPPDSTVETDSKVNIEDKVRNVARGLISLWDVLAIGSLGTL